MKNGFTLIELLIVVLIIGILAAIALPQYQRAVEKSRAAEALTNGKTIQKALNRMRLAGVTDFDWDDLDISFSWENGGGNCPREKCRFLKNFSYEFDEPSTADKNALVVRRYFTDDLQSYYFHFGDNYVKCFSRTERARGICIALGGYNEQFISGTTYSYLL